MNATVVSLVDVARPSADAAPAPIVRDHGGQFEAASDGRDRGSTFILQLPLRH